MGYSRINAIAADGLAGFACKVFMKLVALIDRATAVEHVAHRHPTTTHTASNNTLQQGCAFAYHTAMPLRVEGAIIVELVLMAAKLSPTDIARVMILQKCGPVLTLDLARVAFNTRGFAWQGPPPRLGASIDVRPSVERVVQDRQHTGMAQRPPHHFAVAFALPQPHRYLQAVIAKVFHHR